MQIEGVLASIIFDDFFEVGEAMLKEDPQIIAVCKEFGIDNMDNVAIDPWPSAKRSSLASGLPVTLLTPACIA